MKLSINLVNQLAWWSTPAGCGFRPFRLICRKAVHVISALFGDQNMDERVRRVNQGIIDLEPWPYSDPDFAKWPEDDSPHHYTLVSNPANFITGHPTAYCSAMIHHVTGRWPTNRSYDRITRYVNEDMLRIANNFKVDCPHGFDAKNWRSFLALNGFCHVRARPQDGRHYVGINPYQGEFGEVVWFERCTNKDFALVSTRRENTREFTIFVVPISDYKWVLIDREFQN